MSAPLEGTGGASAAFSVFEKHIARKHLWQKDSSFEGKKT